ncbi:glycosyltransferase family 4 protein [Sphingomonas sp. URHD0057]|uniref:glycosyltransferase family 4 protein n=1 Tax=Sphingomonas sp. URHD0057 TaxID=1380389 RepID=UPI00068454E3|nr:glycosyltransferase family 1 protein [Sphingomonas sp. URHD0057]
MRIALASDAWHPQVNGVVRSLSTTVEGLRRSGHEVEVIEPSRFVTVPCPTYPEIRLSLACGRKVRKILTETQPDSIHIATEGPIGWAARSWCIRNERSYTTAFHTRFPDYVSIRTGIPVQWLWKMMRRFHGCAERTFAATTSLAEELNSRGIERIHIWPRGVDLDQFNPKVPPHPAMASLPRPILLNVGRVAPEKNIEAFLDLELEGSKVVVGGGPALERMREAYPDVLFLGPKHGAELASAYTAADVFVFPSRTDTFGLVNIEALACGLPVAAYPVAGPIDILGGDGCGIHGGSACIGAVDEDLAKAVARTRTADRRAAATEATHYSWDRCTRLFVEGLVSSAARKKGGEMAWTRVARLTP